MKISFSGSRKGTTTAQLHTFREWLYENPIEEFHVGVSGRADFNAVQLVYGLFEDETILHCHPCIIYEQQCIFPVDFPKAVWYPIRKPLVRNLDMVDATELLFAAPETDEEKVRSGTWATIRYAKEKNKEVRQLRRMGGYIL